MAAISKRVSGATVSTLLTATINLRSIRWTGATTAGHVATITNTAGDVLWTSVAGGSNYVEESPLSDKWEEPVLGLKISVIGSGTIVVYYKG